MQADIAQIFFPHDCTEKEGYLIGFNIQGFVFTIITVDDKNDFQTIEKNLSNWQNQNTLQQLCGVECIFYSNRHVYKFQGSSKNNHPFNHNWTLGCTSINRKTCPQRVSQFVAMNIELNAVSYSTIECPKINVSPSMQLDDLFPQIEPLSQRLLQRIVLDEETRENLMKENGQDSLISHQEDFNTLELLQHSFDSKKILQESVKELHELHYSLIHVNMSKIIIILYERLFHHDNLQPNKLQTSLYTRYFSPQDEFLKKALRMIITLSSVQRFIFLQALKVVEFKIPILKVAIAQLPIFKNTLAQVKFKLGVMNQWEALTKILTSPNQPFSCSLIFRAYHQLFAGLIYIFVDTMLGVMSLLFLYFNVQTLLEFIHKYSNTIHIQVLSEEVEWLMGFPAGLKTNKPLNLVMGHLILQVILLWNHVTTFLTPYEPYLLRVMLVFCLFGVTFQITMASDLISVCTIHVQYIYRGVMLMYREIGNYIMMLYQVTKDRYFDVQSQKWQDKTYQWDQKILAMFFCFFLVMMMPTIALYYFWFLLIVLFIYVVNVFLNTILQVFNQFPLFLVILYIRFPSMFPISVTLEVQKQKDPDLIYTEICATKMPISCLFKSFVKKIISLRKIVDIPAVLKSALYGQDIMQAIRKQANKQQRKRSKHFEDFIEKKNIFSYNNLQELRKL